MKQCPKIYNLMNLVADVNRGEVMRRVKTGEFSFTMTPARPVNYFSFLIRIKAAWLVFRGKADAVVWPEDILGIQKG